MKRLAVLTGAMLLMVVAWLAPSAAQAIGTGDPVVSSPTDGAVVDLGLSEIGIDFSDAPVGLYSLTVSRDDATVVASGSYDFDGSNPVASVAVSPIDEPGEYVVSVFDESETRVQQSRFVARSAIQPPGAPGDPTATSGSQEATLLWRYLPGSNGGSALTAYEVQLGTALATRQTLSPSARSHRFANLTNGTSYRLYVRAENAAGFGPWASAVALPASRPSAPASPHASGASHRATVYWSYEPGDNGGLPLSRYQVQRGTSSSTRHNLSRSARAYTYTGLTNGTTYRLYVRAQNALGSSPWVSALATPASVPWAPASTRATASSHRARLYWGYATGGNGGARLDGYQVQRGSSLASRVTLPPTVRSHLFTGLTNGYPYKLYVRAHNRMGYGPWARATARPHAAVSPAPTGCTPGYSLCLPPASDWDCAGGGGDGPRFVQGPIRVFGSDPYDLDGNGDGVACED